MKREEKNLISRQKILDSAFLEFGEQGYGLSSINTICSAGNISKGNLYHHFKDRDELYLSCVQVMFAALTAYLQEKIGPGEETPQNRFEQYFSARLDFFRANPLYHKLFCDVIIGPPAHLAQSIAEIKKDFDALNISVLTDLLRSLPLRNEITVELAVETFRLYQDFVNARYQMEALDKSDVERHEQICKRSLNILLYGVVKREVEFA